MAVPQMIAARAIQRYPLSEWLLYRAYDPERRVYWLADGRWGVCWRSHPLAGWNEQLQLKAQTAFELELPAGTTIQVALHGSRRIDGVLDAFLALRRDAHPDDRTWAERVAAFYRERTAGRLVPSIALPPRDWRCYVSVTLPGDPSLASADRAVERLTQLGQVLEQVGLRFAPLDPTALLALLHELVNPGHAPEEAPPEYDPRQSLAAQAVRYDTRVAVEPDWLSVDGWAVAPLSVQVYPDQWHGAMRETIGRSLQSMEQIGVPCWISMTALRLDQQRAAAQVGKKHVVASNQAFSGLVRLIPMIGKKKQAFDTMMEALSDGRHLWAMGHQVILYAPDPATLNAAVESTMALYRGLGWQLQRDRYIGLVQWLGALPMQAVNDPTEARHKLRRLKTLHSGAAAALLPAVADWKGTPQRPVLLYTTRSGQLVGYDLYANPTGNYNVCIAAKSGGGKSFWTNDLIRAYLSIGGRVWMIDAGNSYRTLADLLGDRAAYIQWSQESRALALNPFASAVDREPDTVAQLRVILSQMLSPSRALSDWERSVLEEIVAEVLTAAGSEATVTDVQQRLAAYGDPRARDMATQLGAYARGGMYADWFHRSGRLPWDAPFIVLELDGLQQQQELRSVILLQLLMAIQQEMYMGDRAIRKICAMDEAWDLLSKAGHTADFFETGVRRVRKYNGSIVVITQGVDDFYTKLGLVGRALLNNSDYLVLPMQKSESIEAIKQSQQLAMSDYELKALASVFKTDEYAEFMFCLPTGREVLRHVVDDYSKLVYTTKADDLTEIRRIASEEGCTRLAAIERLAARRAAQSASSGARLVGKENGGRR
jgi:conjugal transfer ATP-binding protein TraC